MPRPADEVLVLLKNDTVPDAVVRSVKLKDREDAEFPPLTFMTGLAVVSDVFPAIENMSVELGSPDPIPMFPVAVITSLLLHPEVQSARSKSPAVVLLSSNR